MVVWHPAGVSDRHPRVPSLSEIEDTLYDVALLVAAWLYINAFFWS